MQLIRRLLRIPHGVTCKALVVTRETVIILHGTDLNNIRIDSQQKKCCNLVLSSSLLGPVQYSEPLVIVTVEKCKCLTSGLFLLQRIDWPPEAKDYELCLVKGSSKVRIQFIPHFFSSQEL